MRPHQKPKWKVTGFVAQDRRIARLATEAGYEASKLEDWPEIVASKLEEAEKRDMHRTGRTRRRA